MEKQHLFIDGEIITVNGEEQIAEAVAVKGNKIIAVGSNEQILKLENDNSEIVNLNKKTLIPGFIDSHLHISVYGANQVSTIPCKSENIRVIKDLLREVKEKANQIPKGEWIRASEFNEDSIEDQRFPTKEELDYVTSEHPIIITRTCGHISVVNSYALQLADIDKNTSDPDGGKIGRNTDGELNGMLYENAHMNMFSIASLSEEELSKAHKVASDHFAEKGITSIHDATGYGIDNIKALQKDSKNGVIKQRVYAMLGALNDAQSIVKHMIDAGIFTGLGDDKFRIGPVKLFLDGSSSGPTVWTREPYTSNPENYGIHYFSQEELDELFVPAHEKGWQITAHAQGDAAINMLLNTIEKANNLHPRENTRHRIEHAGIASPDLRKRMESQKVVPIPNPAFLYEYGDGYIENYGERANDMYPMGSYQNENIPAAIASDCPVTDFNPMRGIHASVTRKSNSGQVIDDNKSVSLLQAIRMYTVNGAYASFEEDIKGSIEPGKLADLVLLDRSILSSDIDDLPEVQVEWTMLDGEIIYTKSKTKTQV
ncbi:amidohydrolase [Lentibacillus cibarius]|uniref:Amidohydrolase n=1 Tax=Lentibacillus cibarius TaxID=2583219 RepID=A0A549YJK4_9BACI|nr:amidohydrolase [Lentibacillus cibarius]RYG71324.1 amidohydrolase [Lentibacillus lipolyticus]TRM12051.1 amidohydrolase [Lentibacillus cibarius]